MLNSIEVDEIIEKNINNGQLTRYAAKFKRRSRRIYETIKSNDDVDRYFNEARRITDYYEKEFSGQLLNSDMNDMEESVADYENAVIKVLNCYHNSEYDFHYNAEELEQLIKNVREFTMILDNQWMIKAGQGYFEE